MAEQELNFRIKATDDGASSVIQRFGENARREARGLGGSNGAEGAIEQLKGTFGHTGSFTEATHILGGAGPIIGFSLASRELKEMAENLEKVRDDLRDTNKNAADVALDIGKSIPLLSGWVEAGESINSLLTDQKRDIDLITESTKLQDEYTKQHAENVRAVRLEYEQLAITVRNINQETARVGLGGSAGFASTSDELKNRIESLTKGSPERTKELEEQRKKSTEHISKAQEAQAKFRTAFNQVAPDENISTFDTRSPAANSRFKNSDARQTAIDAKNAFYQAGREIAKLQQDQRDAETTINKKYNETDKAETEKAKAELAQIGKEASEARQKEILESEKQISRTKAEAQASALRLTGQNYQADVVLLKQSLAEENQAVDQALKERLKSLEQQRAAGLLTGGLADEAESGAKGEADRQKAANQAKFDADADEAKKNRAIEQQQIDQRIADAKSQSIQNELAAGGELYAQDRARLQIQEEYNRKRQELNELLKTATPEQQKQIEQLQKQLGIDEQQAQTMRGLNALQSTGEAMLRNAAAGGDRIAQYNLKKFEIQKESLQRQHDLQGVIHDPTASADAKTQAQALLALQPGQEKADLARAAMQGIGFVSPLAEVERVAGGPGGAFERGGGEMQKERAFLRQESNPAIDLARESNKLLAEIVTGITALVTKESHPKSIFGGN